MNKISLVINRYRRFQLSCKVYSYCSSSYSTHTLYNYFSYFSRQSYIFSKNQQKNCRNLIKNMIKNWQYLISSVYCRRHSTNFNPCLSQIKLIFEDFFYKKNPAVKDLLERYAEWESIGTLYMYILELNEILKAVLS